MPKGVYERNKPKTILVCKYCGKKFEVTEAFKNQKYCSQQCYWVSQIKRIKLICKYCGKEFEVLPYLKNQKYCSIQCTHLGRRRRVKIVCEVCGKEVETLLYDKNRKYCSHQCHSKFSVGRPSGRKGEKYPKEEYPNFGQRGKPSWTTGLTKETDKRVAKLAEGVKKKWEDPEYQKSQARGRNLRPNNPERIFDELTPDIVRYVGDFNFCVVTKKKTHNPDFKVRGQKKVIELFGDYWHEGENPKELIKEYAEMGWECKVFWEHKVLNEPEKVLDEVLKFIKRG